MKKYCGLLIFLFFTSYSLKAQVKFVIESLPETTLASDSIFISGTFNDWNTNDPIYLLRKQTNGQLAITLNMNETVFEYKFTRGDWLKVETGEKNEYIPNRVLTRSGEEQTVLIRIQNWQDLGGARSFEYLIFYYFSVGFSALIIMILSVRAFKRDSYRRNITLLIHGFLLLLFGGIVAYYVINPILQAYMTILGQVMVFLWGPALFFFAKAIRTKNPISIDRMHFLPSMMALPIAVLRLFNAEFLAFLSDHVSGFLTWGKMIMLGTGGLIALGYLVKLMLEERKFLLSPGGDQKIFSALFILINLLGVGYIILSIYSDFMGYSDAAFVSYKLFFVLVSLIVWLELFMIWRDPLFFKEKPQTFHIDSADKLLSRLKILMEQDKVYHEPELSVNRLAELIDTKSHILSKLLNEHYEQNFRDFVNAYRVQEFIHLANSGKLENLTYLGLAHEVGFNSKSTFNLAFKKITSQSPRAYFKSESV